MMSPRSTRVRKLWIFLGLSISGVLVAPASGGGQQAPKQQEQPEKIPAVDQTAPEIAGESIDGQMLNLSDYRGKIVMLHFWGNWCPPCRAMYPRFRVWSQHLDESDFVILGVNSDPGTDGVKELQDDGTVTWQSFRDEHDAGKISRDWGVAAWPTIFLLDAEGVIRYKGHGEDLDERLAELLRAGGVEYSVMALEAAMEEAKAEPRKQSRDK